MLSSLLMLKTNMKNALLITGNFKRPTLQKFEIVYFGWLPKNDLFLFYQDSICNFIELNIFLIKDGVQEHL